MEPQEPVLIRLRALLAESDGEAEDLVRLLGRRLRALRDRGMRRAALLTCLEESDDAAVVATLEHLWRGSLLGREPHRELLQELALDGSLLRELGYDRVTDLYEVAVAADLTEVQRMFLGDRHRANPTQDEAQIENEHLELSAGQRRSAARGRDRFTLDRVLHDRDPRVIATFLDNPRAVERDVVRITAMRPTRPAILAAVAAHPRWAARYRVRLALVCNPYTPLPISTLLVGTLLVQDVRLLISAIPVAPELKTAARRALDQRLRAREAAPGAQPTEDEEQAAAEESSRLDGEAPVARSR
ncbi:MAG: hypothetical protein ABIO70_36990 [Pseudomonadota bacterium]